MLKRIFTLLFFATCAAGLAACSQAESPSPEAAAPAGQTGPASASQPDQAEAGATGTEPASEPEQAGSYHKITAEEAKKMIDGGGVTVVDVRRLKEYNKGHIPGSILVPNESITDQPPEALPDKDAVLLIHCRSGVRSKQASDKLVSMGYRNVYDFGGIVDWPYETVSEPPAR